MGELLGGLGIGLELVRQYQASSPTVFSIGPLNGYFPFASKFSLLSLGSEKLYEAYVGGRFALMMRFANVDSLVVSGTSAQPVYLTIYPSGLAEFMEAKRGEATFLKTGVVGRRSFLTFSSQQSLADAYFSFPEGVGRRLYLSNLLGIMISGGVSYEIDKEKEYREVYREVLEKGNQLEVVYSDKFSCGGCPAGCDYSQKVEERPELILSHCLVTCGFANKIYESVPGVFSCLSSLGYSYRHEDLEIIGKKVSYLKSHLIL